MNNKIGIFRELVRDVTNGSNVNIIQSAAVAIASSTSLFQAMEQRSSASFVASIAVMMFSNVGLTYNFLERKHPFADIQLKAVVAIGLSAFTIMGSVLLGGKVYEDVIPAIENRFFPERPTDKFDFSLAVPKQALKVLL